MAREFDAVLDEIDNQAGILADMSYVDEAWAIRGFMDGVMGRTRDTVNDPHYNQAFDAGRRQA